MLSNKLSRINKTGRMALLALLCVLGAGGTLSGYYYSEDFGAGASGWTLGYRYGRAGITRNPTTATVSAPGNSRLEFRGRINNSSAPYLGIWAGRMALYQTLSFVASSTNPFGVEFRRIYSRIDPHDDATNPESHRFMSAMSFWLIRDPFNMPDSGAEFTYFPDAVVMYELMRMDFNTNSGQPRSTWGAYQVSEQPFDLTQAVRPDGSTRNIINDVTYGLEWNYDDYWTRGTYATGGVANGTPDNNNPVTVRLTHDGSTVRFYINPNPDSVGGNPYPNEYLQVGSLGVDWNTSMKFAVAMESKRMDTETESADVDSVLVRSVASSLKAELTPASIAKGSTNTFQVVVAPTFSANDAGIGEIIITKPAGYGAISWTPSQVQVFSDKGTGTNHGVLSGLQAMTYTAGVPTVNNQVYITASGDTLKIRFRQAANSLTDTGVVNSSTGSTADDRKVVVVFSMASPNTASGTGESFTVMADCVKYDGQLYPRWGTTGRMLAVAGNAHDGIFDNDSLTVRRFDNPDALATISPGLLYVGPDRDLFLFVSTTNQNAPGISELRIRVPNGYSIAQGNGGRYSSLYISDDNNHVFGTNVNGTNYIYVRYQADGGMLPSPGGIDRISIRVQQTPSGFAGAQTNTVWRSHAYSAIPGTQATETRTNASYPNRNVIVRLPPPVIQAALSTTIVEGGTNYIYNHVKYNRVLCSVRNTGLAGNDLKMLYLQLPTNVANAQAFKSAVIPSGEWWANLEYIVASNMIKINYEGASTTVPGGGGTDTIEFWITDTLTPMSGNYLRTLSGRADNLNGDTDLALVTADGVGKMNLVWKNPPAVGNARVYADNGLAQGTTNRIYTSEFATPLRIELNNAGGLYNNIKIAEITVPAAFTNIGSVNSLRIINDGANISWTNNKITLRYHNDSAGDLPDAGTDTITFTAVDNVPLLNTSIVTMAVRVGNTTSTADLKDSGNLGEGNKRLHFVKPPVLASGKVRVDSATPLEIDSSTVTNTLVYTLKNTGTLLNSIGELRIYIPDTIASNLLDVTSTQLASHSANRSIDTSGPLNYVRLLYHGANPLAGGMEDVITFKMVDHVIDETNLVVTAAASNVQNQWTTLSVTAGGTNILPIRLPPASARIRVLPNVAYINPVGMTTNLVTVTISNTGTAGNNITNAVITLPDIFSSPNVIIGLSNRIAGAVISYSGFPSPITMIYYTNTKILPGQIDTIYIRHRNSFGTMQLDKPFSVTVNNGRGPVVAPALAGSSLLYSLVVQPECEIAQDDTSPNQIYTTDTVSTFEYKIRNGASGGKALARVKLPVPYPFIVDDIVVDSPWPGSVESIIGTDIIVNYSAVPLNAGSQDTITITVKDVLVSGTTSVVWTGSVDYGDGAGYRAVKTASGKSTAMAFVFPDAVAAAWITPRQVNMNDIATAYSLSVTNTGVPGNHIKKIEIDMTSAFTNLSGISSALGGQVSLVSNRIIRINYEAAATNLPSGRMDTISYIGNDIVTGITNRRVQVKVSNSTNTAFYRAAGEISLNSLQVSFYRPDYIASAFIKPVPPFWPERPYSIDATVTTSTLEMVLINNGAPGNELDIFKFLIPGPHFDPASLAGITSTRVPGTQIIRSGNEVTVYYTNGTAIPATASDTIRFRINDTVSASDVTTTWVSTSHFNTSGLNYITNLVATGQSNTISLVMPDPLASARLVQQRAYLGSNPLVLALDVTNRGRGSNKLTRVRITLPVAFRTGFTTAVVANSFASASAYAGGVLTLDYTNFTPGKNDRIRLTLQNGFSETTDALFLLDASNGVRTAAVAEWGSGALSIRVGSAPSAYVETPNFKDGVPNRLYSTDHDNQYLVYLRNDGTVADAIGRARIVFPAGFSLVAASARVGGAFVDCQSNVIEVDYAGGAAAIPGSEYDTLTVTGIDPYHGGVAVATVAVSVRDIDPLGFNPGFSSARLYTGKTLAVTYVHPPVAAEYRIDRYQSGEKPSALVAQRGTIAVTNLQVVFNNTGMHSNQISRVRLTMPGAFAAVSNVVSAAGGTITVSGQNVTLLYAPPVQAGSGDTVSFDAWYAISDATNNQLIQLRADNDGGSGLENVPVASGWFNLIDLKYPPIAILAGVKNITRIYTIDTNASIEYLIKNRAQGHTVFRSIITNFNMSLFERVRVTSTRASGVAIATNQGFITLDYDPLVGLPFNETDTIRIDLDYQISGSTVSSVTLQAIALLATNGIPALTNTTRLLEAVDTDTGYTDTQRLTVGPAPFARLSGLVLPRFKVDPANPGAFLPNIVKVEVLERTVNTVVRTPYNREVGSSGALEDAPLSTYTDPATGRYTLGFVPGNPYRLRFSSGGFRMTLTNFTFLSNQNQTAPQIMLGNDYLDADANNDQLVVDYSDTNTRFIMPEDALLNQFSLDISVVDMNDPQELDVRQGKTSANLTDTALLGCFRFLIRNQQNETVSGAGIGGDATLILHYTTSNLNLPLGGEWQEQDLAIYYWKATTGIWVPVGGLVDTDRKIVSARVNYLHDYYAVLAIPAGVGDRVIYNVTASPNPFTPGRGGTESGEVKLTFSFNKAHPEYSVSIYNMRGQRVREFKRDGGYRQGEVFWDGRNADGFRVPGGVYLYQIRAGGQVFSGTILMLQ